MYSKPCTGGERNYLQRGRRVLTCPWCMGPPPPSRSFCQLLPGRKFLSIAKSSGNLGGGFHPMPSPLVIPAKSPTPPGSPAVWSTWSGLSAVLPLPGWVPRQHMRLFSGPIRAVVNEWFETASFNIKQVHLSDTVNLRSVGECPERRLLAPSSKDGRTITLLLLFPNAITRSLDARWMGGSCHHFS